MDEWISVEERLPESEYVKVLACQSRNGIIETARLKGGVWMTGISPMDCLAEVTHWMHLPLPPEPPK